MSRKRLLVIGSGQRVCNAALPVFDRASEQFELVGVVSRTPKRIESEGRSYEVEPLDALTPARLAEVDLIYMVVAKPAVPGLLARLTTMDVSRVDMLIETPVMLFRHFGHLGALRAFRNVWVSEDTKTLPCFSPVHSLENAGELGGLSSVMLEESAYAYHGVAMLKAALSCVRVKGAQQAKRTDGRRDRVFTLAHEAGGVRVGRAIDPRDYARGTMRFEFARGVVADHSIQDQASALMLEPMLAGAELTGFRVGDHRRELDSAECSLMGTRKEGVGLTAWMDGMKRVGFLELMRDIAAGRGAYPLDAAVEDAVVDYHLEKFKRYIATPVTDPSRSLTRLSYRLLTKLAGG